MSKFIEKTEVEFNTLFGNCVLSLCEEHPKMMCENCKYKSFLKSKLTELIEKVKECKPEKENFDCGECKGWDNALQEWNDKIDKI